MKRRLKTPALDAWRASAPPGTCPECRKPLPLRKDGSPVLTCPKRACFRVYYRLYRSAYRPRRYQRDVVGARLVRGEKGARSFVVDLDCGHQTVVPEKEVGGPLLRRNCPVCAPKKLRPPRIRAPKPE